MKVTVKGVNLNVAQAGSGKHALVFLHYWGGSSRDWSSVKVDPLDVVKAHILPAFRDPETHFLKNKGHLLPIEAPRELVEILGKFAARAFA